MAWLLPLLVMAAPAHATSYRYTVRFLEKDVGKLTVTEGAPAKGHTPISVKGRLVVPGSNLDMVVAAKSALTSDFLSSRIEMRFAIFGAPREVDGTIDGGHFHGTFREGAAEPKTLDDRRTGGIGDLTTFGYWLARQPTDAGVVRTAAFAGFFVYAIEAAPGAAETIALPIGPRLSQRWEISASRPGKTRKVTIWTDPKRKIPLMARLDLDFLGPVTVMLSAQR